MNVMDFLIFEDEEIYHSQSKSGKVLSSHMLMTFVESPKLYQKKITGAIAERPRSAFSFGSAAHKLILEGREAFDKEFVVSDGPINEKTGQPYGSTTKAYLEWKYSQDCEIISIADYAEICKLNYSVENHTVAKDLLSTGVAEAVVRTDYCGIPCQIRMDWFNPEMGIVDLKTTAEIKWFEKDCFKYNYVQQMAFYQAVLEQATGKKYPVYIIAVEKQEPYACGVWNITQSALNDFRLRNAHFIAKLIEAKKTMKFETGYEKLRYLGEQQNGTCNQQD